MKSLFPKFLVLTTVIILGSVSLWAGNIEEADSAYLKGDYAQAVEYYKKVVDTDGRRLWPRAGKFYSCVEA